MSTDFDSFTNRGEYFAAHYFADQLGVDLKKGLLATWSLRETDEHDKRRTPRQKLRDLRTDYLSERVRAFFAESAEQDAADDDEVSARLRTHNNPEWAKRLGAWHQKILDALGFEEGPTQLPVYRAGREHVVEAAWHGDGIVAVECGWAAVNDSALDADGPGRLLHPLRVGASEAYETGPALATWLFQSELNEAGGAPPRFVILLCGGVIVLADRQAWAEGRFLTVNLDAALERNDRKQLGELATIAALFSHEMLVPGEDGKGPQIDALLKASTDNAVGVSGELREGLQRSVEIIANEVLARLDAAGVEPRQVEDIRIPFAKELTRESLRYLYRILFLLYAEARPELGILPADDGSYEAGYSVARLRELVERDEQLIEEEARNGFHLFESLHVLFDKVNNGHRPYGTESDDDLPGDDEATRKSKAARRSEDRGLRFEPLRSELFEPNAIRLIGRSVNDPRAAEDSGAVLDLRLRNSALHEVLRLLTMKKATRRGDRGGFISYRNLGINQLGAVYEGLMSYTGIIAEEELCEVAKGGDPDKGSWLVPAHRQKDYPSSTLVEYDEHDNRKGLRGPKRYPAGSFVYRLAGRDRETSASYYTPESLTKVTVELALKHLLDQERDADGNTIRTPAAELLKYKICEPALGSGAFLNEAINQVADEYLRRRQDELGVSIPTADALTEKQKAKAYIALHNAYGVDLNATGVELAEVSLWLNTMHPGMRAPWFGLHLRRGNSLIGARRAVYSGEDVASAEKAWLKAKGGLAPTPLPFLKDGVEQPLPQDAVYQFLLPSPGWAAVAGATEAKEFADSEAHQLAAWKRGILQRPKRSTAHLNTKTGAPKIKDGKPQPEARSQFTRLRDAARRVEFLWALVVKRMEISEQAIARRIDVWGADPTDPEYGFLRRPKHAVSKEQVFEDLFNAVDTPYWRLKTVMDAWCALWFWPVDKAALLDGTDGAYEETVAVDTVAVSALLGESPVASTTWPRVEERFALFALGPEQTSLADLEPKPDDELIIETATIRQRSLPKAKPKAVPLRDTIPLKNLDDWLDFLEAMLGTGDVSEDEIISQFNNLDELKDFEAVLPAYMGMDPANPEQRFPWLHTVRDIAVEHGFLHWELEFALVFTRGGGFDMQVGNPPWVQPVWKEGSVFSEFEPWFELTEKPSAADKARRRAAVVAMPDARIYILRELAATVAMSEYLSNVQVYPLIAGSQPDLYRAFMCQTWNHASFRGCVGLIHPDTHFNGEREADLREAAYRRLRVHADFVNAGNRFFPPPIGRSSHFGLHVYSSWGEIGFDHLSWLYSVDSLRLSNSHDGSGDTPGVRYNGSWDERPHKKRVVRVNAHTLARWKRLSGEHGVAVEKVALLTPVSTDEDPAIDALGSFPLRLGACEPQITRGFDETGARKPKYGPDKRSPLIDFNKGQTDRADYEVHSWSEVILKGIQLGVANPLFKQPSHGGGGLLGLNHEKMSSDAVPESEYRQTVDDETYIGAQDKWIDHARLELLRASRGEIEKTRLELSATLACPPSEITDGMVDNEHVRRSKRPYSEFYRLAWRRQIASDTERALYAALIPPGAAHVISVNSLAMANPRWTALVAGFWASLPLDYFLRATGRTDLLATGAKAMPAPLSDHPLASALLLRTLRLNCLTTAYADLWQNVIDPACIGNEPWAFAWKGMRPLDAVGLRWQRDTPLRSERARRAALVEIDALVAVWLGIPAETLIAMYRARFPIMQDFDRVTWFDSNERKIAGNRYAYGHGQEKAHFIQLEGHLKDPNNVPPPEGYSAPFYKADREVEMREAHAVFRARLEASIERGEWDPVKQEVPQR
ncbi:class I SAM-dependent DNA methyltransferase [Lentzea sp. HUAS12]|uniref:class I SAM-dependent DNA methyltransferase n=1 Tax=Lentzea sp. HUAS12 TaxID=2951806 RepID=UPI00209D256A|nr:class I SAM-dependent DNA methyltransferase [Lentzea sp. HUAS12]USX56245.1 class I SAM-dependent DNA methyltransferase [Lentzea sp. HUAS12]